MYKFQIIATDIEFLCAIGKMKLKDEKRKKERKYATSCIILTFDYQLKHQRFGMNV